MTESHHCMRLGCSSSLFSTVCKAAFRSTSFVRPQLFLPTLLFSLRSFSLQQPPPPPTTRITRSLSMSIMETLQVKRLSQNAILPVRGSEWAAGYDLASAEDTVVPANGKALIKTDLSIAIPIDTYARIAPRSGLAWKKHIDVGAGVIDYDYRGPVGVVLFNHGKEDFEVKKGDRVAQMILERICMAPVQEVEDLPETARGAGGFGSTGVASSAGAGSSENHPVSGASKRMKGESMEVENPGEKAAQLLVMLNKVASTFPDETALVKKLKPLALAEDSRLYAAFAAYQVNKDIEDLKDTLKLIFNSSEQ